MVIQSTVQKWGNSFGIRLRKVVAEHLNLRAGSRIDIDVADGKLVITPSVPEYSLDDLVSKITAQNLHGEARLGKPVGNEAW